MERMEKALETVLVVCVMVIAMCVTSCGTIDEPEMPVLPAESADVQVLGANFSGKYTDAGKAFLGNEEVLADTGTFMKISKIDLDFQVNASGYGIPAPKDSIFRYKECKMSVEKNLREIKEDVNGYTVASYQMKVTSTNCGQSGWLLEFPMEILYEVPLKYVSEYGSYEIDPYEVYLENSSFSIEKHDASISGLTVYRAIHTVDVVVRDSAGQLNKISVQQPLDLTFQTN